MSIVREGLQKTTSKTEHFGEVINHSLKDGIFHVRLVEGMWIPVGEQIKLSNQTTLGGLRDMIYEESTREIQKVDIVQFDEDNLRVIWNKEDGTDWRDFVGDILRDAEGEIVYFIRPNSNIIPKKFGWVSIDEPTCKPGEACWSRYKEYLEEKGKVEPRKLAVLNFSDSERETIWEKPNRK